MNRAICCPDQSHWNLPLLQSLDWKVFEELTAEALRQAGCQAILTSRGPDGGVDILVSSPGAASADIAVQCKRHRRSIGVETVRALQGSSLARDYSTRIFVTSGTFSESVYAEFGTDPGVRLIDGAMFLEGIQELGSEVARELLRRFASADDFHVPTCPNCDLKMIRRKGRKSGKAFWGCPNYGSTANCRKKFFDAQFPDFASLNS